MDINKSGKEVQAMLAYVRRLIAIDDVGQEGVSEGVNLFDFGDGIGPVPAHRHPNGGGWVADTAHVAESVYVGPEARVFGNAVLRGNTRVSGAVWVSGENTLMSGDGQIIGPIIGVPVDQ